jgi:hypothetical protein
MMQASRRRLFRLGPWRTLQNLYSPVRIRSSPPLLPDQIIASGASPYPPRDDRKTARSYVIAWCFHGIPAGSFSVA